MPQQAYEIKLENIFEGPMDLLVHLIKKNEIDIYDIPISFITEQFLAYLDWMRSMNVDIASEFLVMAATLAHIKSRMLLPAPKTDPELDEGEDPRLEIADQLVQYLKMQSVAEQLAERAILHEDVFVRNADLNPYEIDPVREVIKTDLYDLIQAYYSLLSRSDGKNGLHITPERVSVKDRMTEIINIIEEKGTIAFHELLPRQPDKAEIIITFLAVLEIVKLKLIRIVQTGRSHMLRLFYK